VLCDIGLPGMSGYDVARAIRADPDVGHTALVALTGYASPADVQRAVEAGFDCHLAKPIRPEDLSRVLTKVARSGAARRGA
jgi:CheY-like chemotaxis protein